MLRAECSGTGGKPSRVENEIERADQVGRGIHQRAVEIEYDSAEQEFIGEPLSVPARHHASGATIWLGAKPRLTARLPQFRASESGA